MKLQLVPHWNCPSRFISLQINHRFFTGGCQVRRGEVILSSCWWSRVRCSKLNDLQWAGLWTHCVTCQLCADVSFPVTLTRTSKRRPSKNPLFKRTGSVDKLTATPKKTTTTLQSSAIIRGSTLTWNCAREVWSEEEVATRCFVLSLTYSGLFKNVKLSPINAFVLLVYLKDNLEILVLYFTVMLLYASTPPERDVGYFFHILAVNPCIYKQYTNI